MSVVRPIYYKQIADKLGEAYAAVRDSIYSQAVGHVGEYGYSNMIASLNLINGEADNSTYNATTTVDPPGSIANDCGATWFKQANTNFTLAQAKTTASNLFSNALKNLNTHVVKRTGVTNIRTFYSSYAFCTTPDANWSLFTSGDISSYWTQDFVELSGLIGVSITEYIET